MAFENSKLVLAQQELPDARQILAQAALHLAGVIDGGLPDATPADNEIVARAHDALQRLAREVDEIYDDLNELYRLRTTLG